MANEKYLNNFNNLYDKFYAKLNNTPAVEYQPQSLSTMKDMLTKIIQPAYKKQIDEIKKTGSENRASISADAGRRGMGSSTVVSDMMNRSRNAEEQNINNTMSDYLSALYSALMNQKNAQDELSMSAQQANAQARQNASGQALGLAQGLYNKVYGSTGSGGGGWGRRGSYTPGDDGGYNPLQGALFNTGLNETVDTRNMAPNVTEAVKPNVKKTARKVPVTGTAPKYVSTR